MTGWRGLTFEDRWYVIKYAITPLWSALFLLYPPSTLVELFPRLQLVLVGVLPLVGSSLAVVGVLAHLHLSVELPGAVLRITGPIAYFLINLPLAIAGEQDRVAFSGLLFVLIVLMAGPRLHYLLIVLLRRIRDPERGTRPRPPAAS